MCGIIGYIGKRDINSVLLDSLKRLEYRGYDSAGVASLVHNRILLRKEKGKIGVLEKKLKTNALEGNLGIGHTRWATHGEPSLENAHPHTDCSGNIAVVHNGIIENYLALRDQLIREGHIFRSQTDSEVIAHLVEKYLNLGGYSFEEALRKAVQEVKGSYALALLWNQAPEKFVVARNGSPLIVGLGKDENFIASDIPAIINYTNRLIYLEDYQVASIYKDKVEVFSLNGERISHKVNLVECASSDVGKNGWAHYMLKEIYEQPEVIRRILKLRNIKENKISFDALGLALNDLKQINRIIIQACGTSYHAGLIGKYILEKFCAVPVEVEISSEFRSRQPIFDERTFVLTITQSGETADTLLGLRMAKAKNVKVVSICNVVASSIARESDGVIYTFAGPEIGVASTKAYTAQLLSLYLFALYLGELKGRLDSGTKITILEQLNRIPLLLEKILRNQDAILEIAERFYLSQNFLFLGRGMNYPNALEGALKLKEIAYIHASGHPAGEMKHGPIALIDENLPVVCIAPRDSVYEKMLSNIQEVKARRAKVISIATENDQPIKELSDYVVYIPSINELLNTILVTVCLQLIAYHIAVKRGCEVDQPRNLAKSVTVE